MLRRPEAATPRQPGALLRRVAGLFLLLGGPGACQSVAPAGDGTHARAPLPAPARGELRALQAALAAGDDETAARLVAALERSELAREERQQLEGARRVLRGRALVAGLEFWLASEEVAGSPGLFELALWARNENADTVTLALPPSDLKRHRATIDARGAEGHELESKLCTVFAELALPAGVASRFVILSYELPLGRALGVRERWRLVARSGELEFAGERYPAAGVSVAGCARERVSPLVAADVPEGATLAAALAAEPPLAARALLEHALALPAARRESALRELAPVVAELASRAPERVLAAEPALRWLTENRDLGADAEAWARYLATRPAASGAAEAEPRARLDLPARPR